MAEDLMGAEYTIEKGIPIPIRHNGTAQFDILDKMQPGDSVLFNHNEWKRARNQAYCYRPKTFTFRRETNGYRCWRIQ
jgi:hypothetical protein